MDSTAQQLLAFVGGGNMAGAIVGGLVKAGRAPASIVVVEPSAEAREKLAREHGVRTLAAADASLAGAAVVVWAVKPQSFEAAARPVAPHARGALQLSVMAGVRCARITEATGAARIVRAMPNTPALIGRGIAGLVANAAATADDRATAEAVLAPTGELMWFDDEAALDAVTALSGSGPAYVFYFVEAMMQAADEMGLGRDAGRRLALATFAGAAALAAQSDDDPSVLRARVTSKGGTTHAAISAMEAAGVKAAFVAALHAARDRARELG